MLSSAGSVPSFSRALRLAPAPRKHHSRPLLCRRHLLSPPAQAPLRLSAAPLSSRTLARPAASALDGHRPLPSLEAAPGLPLDADTSPGGPLSVSWTRDALLVGPGSAHRSPIVLFPATLRDSCTCVRCKDPVSGHKFFASTEIPPDIGLAHVGSSDQGLVLSFANDIPRFAAEDHDAASPDARHQMTLSWASLDLALGRRDADAAMPPRPRKHSVLARTGLFYWDRHLLGRHLRRIDFSDFLEGGQHFWDAVIDLCRLGIVIIRNVPRDESSVLRIGSRIANIRETFYGRLFDVRVKPAPENVAYTSGYLGLHQDLMYLDPPPMIQLLHCIDNSCCGGESLFSDAERVARLLWPWTGPGRPLAALREHRVPYHYERNGFRYEKARPVLESRDGALSGLHWSPPFQSPYPAAAGDLRRWIGPARLFEELINAPDATYGFKMEPGECVIFDNSRLVHGRTAFAHDAGGDRWLRGLYIAEEDFLSRASQIPAGQAEAYRGPAPWTPEAAQRELLASPWHPDALAKVRALVPDAESDEAASFAALE